MTTKRSEGPIFGTDGIRGRALEGWLTIDAVEALGRAAGAVLSRSSDGSEGQALIAHDGRASAAPLQEALARGLAQSGIRATTAGLLPTPGLAWLTGSRPVTRRPRDRRSNERSNSTPAVPIADAISRRPGSDSATPGGRPTAPKRREPPITRV